MRVLVVPDLHLYCEHKNALQFCVDTWNKYDCDTAVFIGDVVDHHSISFHQKNPNCPSAKDEYELTLESLQQWYDTFPEATVCIGNHDNRCFRLAETVNMPE